LAEGCEKWVEQHINISSLILELAVDVQDEKDHFIYNNRTNGASLATPFEGNHHTHPLSCDQ
jgi:hypothetical protein